MSIPTAKGLITFIRHRFQQDRQCTYNLTFRRVRTNIFVVEKQ